MHTCVCLDIYIYVKLNSWLLPSPKHAPLQFLISVNDNFLPPLGKSLSPLPLLQVLQTWLCLKYVCPPLSPPLHHPGLGHSFSHLDSFRSLLTKLLASILEHDCSPRNRVWFFTMHSGLSDSLRKGKSGAWYPDPVNVTLFGKKSLCRWNKVKDLEMRLSSIQWQFSLEDTEKKMQVHRRRWYGSRPRGERCSNRPGSSWAPRSWAREARILL